MKLRVEGRVAWSYVVVIILFCSSWLVAMVALSTVRSGTQSIVVKSDALAGDVQTIANRMVDQETGLRGYLLSSDTRFLEPYYSGRQATPEAFALARQHAETASDVQLLRALRQRVRRWQSWANTQLRRWRSGRQDRVHTTAAQLVGKKRFDSFRAAQAGLLAAVDRQRQRASLAGRNAFRLARVILTLLAIGANVVVVLLAWRNNRLFLREQSARSEVEAADAALRKSAQRYRSLVEISPDAILLIDFSSNILMANLCAATLHRYPSPEHMIGLNARDLIAPSDRGRVREHLRERLTDETQTTSSLQCTMVRQDGSDFPAEISSAAVLHEPDAASAVMIVMRDISERKAFEARLQHQALYDPLTDLPNRVLFQDRLQHALTAGRRDYTGFALLLMDVDRFKEINDTFGHHYGDMLLQQVGPRLQHVLRESDTVARLGGDEFALLLPDADAPGAGHAAAKVLTAMEQPFMVEGNSLVVDVSIGVATYPDHGAGPESLLQHAEVAMYAAKRSNRGFGIYDASQDQHDAERLTLLGELRHALDRDQLRLHYQPKVCTTNSGVRHVEALIRWQHPTRGMIGPGTFIPLAEHTGLIKPLGLWVVAAALRQCRAWHDAGLDINVAVNVSAWNLHDPSLPDTIVQLLHIHRASPAWLTVEVTESAVMAEPARAMDTLQRLSRMGISISIDDFGTGYSSLAYLTRLPVNELKIDKSFVINMLTHEDDATIVRSVLDLGHNLGLQVVAEGVENVGTWDMLRSYGCDLAQGYYLRRPAPPEDLTPWLHQADSEHLQEVGTALGA